MGLRLAPPELDIADDEGFSPDKDIFGRAEFGKGLTRLVQAIEGPAVIALDAPWGAGKTTFLRQWCGDLKQNGIPSIRFDAFANDYKSDAFLALAAEIIGKAEELGVQDQAVAKTFRETAAKVFKRFLRSGFRIGTRALTAGVLDATDFENAAAAAMKATEKEANVTLDDLIAEALTSTKRDEELFDQFRDALGALAKCLDERAEPAPGYDLGSGARGDAKLVFIIDELDRCRPDFALDILERIKHFYNVDSVVFFLSVNMEQLSTSIKYSYGADIDASGYLRKFFNLRVAVPPVSDNRVTAAQKYAGILISKYIPNIPDAASYFFCEMIRHLSPTYKTSLRDVEHIAKNVSITIHINPEYDPRLLPIPMVLCALKLYEPERFEEALAGNLEWSSVGNFLRWGQWDRQRSEYNIRSTEAMLWAAFGKISSRDDEFYLLFDVKRHFEVPGLFLRNTCEYINGFSSDPTATRYG